MCVYAYNVYICKCILYRKSPALFDEVLVEDAELYVCVNTIYMCVNTIYVCEYNIYVCEYNIYTCMYILYLETPALFAKVCRRY